MHDRRQVSDVDGHLDAQWAFLTVVAQVMDAVTDAQRVDDT